MKVTVGVRWVPADLRERIRRSPEIVDAERYNLLDELRAEGTAAGTEEAPVDRSTLRQSLAPGHSQTMSVTRATRAIIGSKLPYAGAQEDAELHTVRRTWWPPMEPIRDWVRRKRAAFGVSSETEINRVAYFVRKKIALQGIRPKRYLAAAYEAIVQAAPRAVEAAAKRIVERLGLKWG